MKTIQEVLAAFEVAALNAGLSRNTRKSYAATIAEFAGLVKAGTITGPQGYFEHLASVKRVSSNTVWHALNPLKFLYEKVLEKEFGTFELPRRNRNQPMRAVLTMREILAMMETMPRVPRLQAGLLAGCGMRIESDMLTLRLKDIRMEDRVITIFEAKGGKSRALRIPEFLVKDLEFQITACRTQWERDRVHGIICPHPEESLMRKFSHKTFGTLPWYWLFPSQKVHGDQRWHATDKRIVTALKEAANIRWSDGRWTIDAAGKAKVVRKTAERTPGKATRNWMAEHLFVEEDTIGLGVFEPSGINQRFVQTWRGSGISYEEFVNAAQLRFTVATDALFSDEIWQQLWLTAEQMGVGATRSQGFGRYAVTSWEKL